MSRFSEFSNATVNSCTKKDFSVFTPSMARTRASTYKSMATSTGFHMSNPNPQMGQFKFKGVRDLGYSKFEKTVDPTDAVRFGKKVINTDKHTSEQVMEEHLRQMREKMAKQRQNHEQKRKQEFEFLN